MKTARDERVFLVRMWRGDDAEWRGSVLQVESGRRFYFSAPGEVAEFIASSVRAAEAQREARDGDGP